MFRSSGTTTDMPNWILDIKLTYLINEIVKIKFPYTFVYLGNIDFAFPLKTLLLLSNIIYLDEDDATDLFS